VPDTTKRKRCATLDDTWRHLTTLDENYVNFWC
jgi:hypothetical protein